MPMTKTDSNPILIAKKAAGTAAAELIQDGMLVGLGTGSTASFFIEALGKRCQQSLNITAIATSQQSTTQAQKLGIPLIDPNTITSLDITVDGADEMDHHKNMIKGGGGALLREKLLALSSREMVVIIDETKLVDHLGTHPLPIEIAPFLYLSTIHRLEEQGYRGVLRLTRDNQPFVTDNGNYIFDIQYDRPILDPIAEHQALKSIAGVLETGLFFHVAGRVVIGYEDGYHKIRE
jgi:ribose 5-phosphate isomerase A